MTMQDRQLEILRAIVDEYVATEEPVGSKVIAEKHGLGVSPATIRNDMAVLEDAGLIKQPHTSAGRIPTNSGYRMFVDKIAEIKPIAATASTNPINRAIRSPMFTSRVPCRPFGFPLNFMAPETRKTTANKPSMMLWARCMS